MVYLVFKSLWMMMMILILFIRQAIDDDQPGTDNSKIEYQIVESEFSHDFTINKDTGILKMTDALDREALDPALNGVIELNVTAYDKGIPPLGTWVRVEINVGVMIGLFVFLLNL